jgi:hypothetical protein
MPLPLGAVDLGALAAARISLLPAHHRSIQLCGREVLGYMKPLSEAPPPQKVILSCRAIEAAAAILRETQILSPSATLLLRLGYLYEW